MTEQQNETAPAWVENTALSAPALLGASAGLLLADLMHTNARRGVGIGLGVIGVAMAAPFLFGGIRGLITGPRSKIGVRRSIQSIRDAGIGAPGEDSVDAELREQGVI